MCFAKKFFSKILQNLLKFLKFLYNFSLLYVFSHLKNLHHLKPPSPRHSKPLTLSPIFPWNANESALARLQKFSINNFLMHAWRAKVFGFPSLSDCIFNKEPQVRGKLLLTHKSRNPRCDRFDYDLIKLWGEIWKWEAETDFVSEFFMYFLYTRKRTNLNFLPRTLSQNDLNNLGLLCVRYSALDR